MEEKIRKIARELAWVVGNAIIDSRDKELGAIPLNALVKIRDIVDSETKSLLKDMMQRNCEINDILNRV